MFSFRTFFIICLFINIKTIHACSTTEYYTSLSQENNAINLPKKVLPPLNRPRPILPPVLLKEIFSYLKNEKRDLLNLRLVSQRSKIIADDMLMPMLHEKKSQPLTPEKLKKCPKNSILVKTIINSGEWIEKELLNLEKHFNPQNFPCLIFIDILDITTNNKADGRRIYRIRKLLDRFDPKNRLFSLRSVTTTTIPTFPPIIHLIKTKIISNKVDKKASASAYQPKSEITPAVFDKFIQGAFTDEVQVLY